ncbi:hypothetical protein ACFL1W_00835 [Candidatus Margulisiibacteriota bacterium]
MVKGKYFEENQVFLDLVRPLDLLLRKFLIPTLFLIVIVCAFLGLSYPIMPLVILVLFYLLVSELMLRLIGHGLVHHDPGYSANLVIDILLVAFATHYSGGIESFVPIIYIVIGVLAGLTLPLWSVLLVAVTSGFAYYSVLALEAFGLLPHFNIFTEFVTCGNFMGSAYIIVTPLMYYLVYLAIVAMSYNVAARLRRQRERQAKLNLELNQGRELLTKREEQLDHKVKELEAFKAKLEENVAARTKDLKETTSNLAGKVKELEEFHDLAVGRELKMIELEKEINQILSELGRPPKYKI